MSLFLGVLELGLRLRRRRHRPPRTRNEATARGTMAITVESPCPRCR